MQDEILEFLRKNADEEFTYKAIAENIGANNQAVEQALIRLLRWGEVERIKITGWAYAGSSRVRWKYKPTS